MSFIVNIITISLKFIEIDTGIGNKIDKSFSKIIRNNLKYTAGSTGILHT